MPAMLASLLFIARVVWLKRHGREHHLGRTGWIYWSTTLAMLVGAFALIARLALEKDHLSQLELIATGSMASSWVRHLNLVQTQVWRNARKTSLRLPIAY